MPIILLTLAPIILRTAISFLLCRMVEEDMEKMPNKEMTAKIICLIVRRFISLSILPPRQRYHIPL